MASGNSYEDRIKCRDDANDAKHCASAFERSVSCCRDLYIFLLKTKGKNLSTREDLNNCWPCRITMPLITHQQEAGLKPGARKATTELAGQARTERNSIGRTSI
jgi:hypothetical protein